MKLGVLSLQIFLLMQQLFQPGIIVVIWCIKAAVASCLPSFWVDSMPACFHCNFVTGIICSSNSYFDVIRIKCFCVRFVFWCSKIFSLTSSSKLSRVIHVSISKLGKYMDYKFEKWTTYVSLNLFFFFTDSIKYFFHFLTFPFWWNLFIHS